MERRDFLKYMLMGGVAMMTRPIESFATNTRVVGPVAKRLTILHTNDVHSHIDAFPANDEKYPGMGGYARRAAYIKQVRENTYRELLVFDCGDMFQGTPYFNFYKGKLEISLMNKMGIDAVTIGNHEFDNGLDILLDRVQEANFPFLNANYQFKDQRAQKLIRPYKVFERCGRRIGVFGLGVKLSGLVSKVNFGDTKYKDPISVADELARQLKRDEHCDLVIAITHIGYDRGSQPDDLKLAAKTRYLDIILGGHTHTFLPEPTFVDNVVGKKVRVNQV